MNETNHECYVSLEVAKLLKEAGFDWGCREYYYNFTTTGWSLSFDDNFVNWNSWSEQYISAPTLDVAQRWLRENLNLIITVEYNEYNYQTFLCKVYSNEECLSILLDFPIYEEAQETGIKKALEIILEKGE